MLVKIRAILVSVDSSLIELFVLMLRLFINAGLLGLQVAKINLYSFRFKVECECFK